MQLKKVAPEQVREWLDSPVTVAFKLACELERDESANILQKPGVAPVCLSQETKWTDSVK